MIKISKMMIFDQKYKPFQMEFSILCRMKLCMNNRFPLLL